MRLEEGCFSPQSVLKDAGALAPTDIKEVILDLEAAQSIVDRTRKAKKGIETLTQEELDLLAQFDPRLDNWSAKRWQPSGASAGIGWRCFA